jgi:putative endonuclease
MKQPCVYILASRPNGTLYVGISTDLARRMAEHDQRLVQGFTSRYGVRQLVYYEHHATIPDAIQREKVLKRWRRQWKLRLIESMNPEWANLYNPATGEIAFGPFDHLRSRS